MDLISESIIDQKDSLFSVTEKSASAPILYTGINFDRYIEFNRSISKFMKEVRDREVSDIWYPVIQNMNEHMKSGSLYMKFTCDKWSEFMRCPNPANRKRIDYIKNSRNCHSEIQ